MDRTWRVGKKLGRTIYINEESAGVMDSPEVAAEIVEAMNYLDSIPVAAWGGNWCGACDTWH